MKIKANRITNLTDARYFSSWNSQWMTFDMEYGSESFIHPKDIIEIKKWLVGPKIIGEFGIGNSEKEINESIELLQLDAIQFSQYFDNNIFDNVKKIIPIFINFIISAESDFDDLKKAIAKIKDNNIYVSLNFHTKALWDFIIEKNQNLSFLDKTTQEYKTFIGFPFEENDLFHLSSNFNFYGLNLFGGIEEKVGMRDFYDNDLVFDKLEELELIEY